MRDNNIYIFKNLEKIYKDINKLIEEKRLIIDNFLLIVVTKTVNSDKIIRAIEYGIVDIAENRVLELLNRQEQFKDFKNVRYHLIGQLQTNKVKKIIGKTFLIHSLDRISLLNELEKVGKEKNIVTDALIQLNISKEDSKSGIYEENLEEFIKACESCKFVKIKGLMTIAPYAENPEDVRWIFSKMKEIFEKLKLNNYENIKMKYLSMGMSNDYKVAIEEGSNMIRIGTAVFENRN